MRKIILILGGLITLTVIVVLVIFLTKPSGAIILNVQPSDSKVTIDGKTVTKNKVKLKNGEYIITAQKNGYIKQQLTVTILKNAQQAVNITLFEDTPKNTADQEIRKYFNDNGLFQGNNTDLQLSNIKSFKNNNWIVGIVKINGEGSITVLKKESSGGYTMLIGPGKFVDYFEEESSSEIPQEVFDEAKGLIGVL